MIYLISDIHGEYGLFKALLKEINFSEDDELYVCGDIIEKGCDSVKLARLIFSMPNAYAIMGNHEDAFLKYYNSLMREHDGDFDKVLAELKSYISESGGDGELLDWDVVEGIEFLPYYIEKEDFICTHAGVPLDGEGRIPKLSSIPEEVLINDRKFKNPDLIPKDSKCVFFGHTATSAVIGDDKIIAYKRKNSKLGDIRDYAKIHLDTCTFVTRILGCFCIDTCRAYYVKIDRPDYGCAVIEA
jgi:serine/threonine protein phosphatase 1